MVAVADWLRDPNPSSRMQARAGQAFLAELGRSTLADLIGPGGPTAGVFPVRAREHLPGPWRRRAAPRQRPGVAAPRAASAALAPIR